MDLFSAGDAFASARLVQEWLGILERSGEGEDENFATTCSLHRSIKERGPSFGRLRVMLRQRTTSI